MKRSEMDALDGLMEDSNKRRAKVFSEPTAYDEGDLGPVDKTGVPLPPNISIHIHGGASAEDTAVPAAAKYEESEEDDDQEKFGY